MGLLYTNERPHIPEGEKMNNTCPNIDYCGALNLLRVLIRAGKCSENEAKKIAARIAVNYGADVITSL